MLPVGFKEHFGEASHELAEFASDVVGGLLASHKIKEIFLEDFHTCTESPLSDEFILSMLLANKRLFSECIVDTEYAGGLFAAGTGLELNFLKEVSTSLFVAAEVALLCVSQVEPKPGRSISAAVNAIVLANSRAFNMWFSDEFNAYAEFFTNLEAAFALWKPHESTPNPSDFHIPRFLNLNIGLSPESALLETTLHASPVISIVAQDIWCFVVRYGSAELCWQYVTLLGNAVLCLAERYSSTNATPLFKAHPPLEQMSRLGCLLSRFLVFLTARQQTDRYSRFTTYGTIIGTFFVARVGILHLKIEAIGYDPVFNSQGRFYQSELPRCSLVGRRIPYEHATVPISIRLKDNHFFFGK
ncbi:hypothetical protein TSMEX_007935 [Taenia solium]|eukprot:TsM_000670500 transcript=TsM_000670500 gene=TsM_000670500